MGKPKLVVVSFSGGKDSTAMLLKMLELGEQVDVILFCDTGLEFPQLYDHIRKVEREVRREITVVKDDYGFEYWLAHKMVMRNPESDNGKKYGTERIGYDWPDHRHRWCTSRLKNYPREQYLRTLREKYDVIDCIGIATDEIHRLKRKCNQRKGIRFPLIEYGMAESDCLNYCLERGYDWGGLYEKMNRVSCWCCPLQSLAELRVLYREFPELWSQLKRWDEMTYRKFRDDYSVAELEKRFDFEEEWQKAGKPLKGRVFYSALKERLASENGE